MTSITAFVLRNTGLTFPVAAVSPQHLEQMKTDLMVVPNKHGGPVEVVEEYPVYNLFHAGGVAFMSVPRYYAEQCSPPRSTKPLIPVPPDQWTNRLAEGNDISVPFEGALRPVQQQAIDAYRAEIDARGGTGGGLFDLGCGEGKTAAAIYVATTVLRKKTLVIVHKEFLANQWTDRIRQFAPTARIGRLQGQTVDIDNRDFVICMLQSLTKLDKYPRSLFQSFGLTIVDEVHHISSKVFSRALYTVVTKHTLGLSATMERKDGTTEVFKWFLGRVVFTSNRDTSHQVEVHQVYYTCGDSEFNDTARNYRGEVQYSTMISKLCTFGPRTDFILGQLIQLLTAEPHRQVMVIAHNRNVLTYAYQWLTHRHPSITVGYYVGGMKEEALKATELCTVVLATYSMAAEALDIPTLSVLFMVSPKTDIVQTVGRILRIKRTDMRPLIYDFVDTHEFFRRQAATRRTFYRKQGYRLVSSFEEKDEEDTSATTATDSVCLIPLKKQKVK